MQLLSPISDNLCFQKGKTRGKDSFSGKEKKREMKPERTSRVEKNLAVQQEVFERAYTSVLNGLKHVDKKTIDTLKGVHSQTEIHR